MVRYVFYSAVLTVDGMTSAEQFPDLLANSMSGHGVARHATGLMAVLDALLPLLIRRAGKQATSQLRARQRPGRVSCGGTA